ncbi:unnamed protein product [Diabrotica balteata]|uniref:Uncharacterized protein n=1 Tax=Diabrotica balteata TaxID=107213 RepID=A0A9N9T9K0_DIABA|nr:unnamed protein product [Diabrotica balteata]
MGPFSYPSHVEVEDHINVGIEENEDEPAEDTIVSNEVVEETAVEPIEEEDIRSNKVHTLKFGQHNHLYKIPATEYEQEEELKQNIDQGRTEEKPTNEKEIIEKLKKNKSVDQLFFDLIENFNLELSEHQNEAAVGLQLKKSRALAQTEFVNKRDPELKSTASNLMTKISSPLCANF